MYSNGLFTLALALCVGRLLSRSPYMMASSAPSSRWADGPVKLVTTPRYATGKVGRLFIFVKGPKTDLFNTGATHMALLHNSIIRGFNSIYLQAPHVPNEEKEAFAGYALTWFRFVKSHHDDEEANLFPLIEEVLDDKQVWAQTHEEHESFLAGLGHFHEYLVSLTLPTNLDGAELVHIMDSFLDPFEHHFHSEIAVIAAMASHPRAPASGSAAEQAAAQAIKRWGKKTVAKQGWTDVVPFFLLNHDRTHEGGLWADWPPMPAAVRWGLVNLGGAWHSAYWPFASCDARSLPRELHRCHT